MGVRSRSSSTVEANKIFVGFTEPVTGLSLDQFRVTWADGSTTPTEFTLEGADSEYILTVPGLATAPRPIRFDIVNDGSVADLSENPWEDAGGSFTLDQDTTAPTYTVELLGAPILTEPVTALRWRVVFNESVQGILDPWLSGTMASLDARFMVEVLEPSREYIVSARRRGPSPFPDGVVKLGWYSSDLHGNKVWGQAAESYVIDSAPPSAVIEPLFSYYPFGAREFTYKIDFSEVPTGVEAEDFTTIGTAADHFEVKGLTNTGTLRKVVTIGTRGDVGIEGTIALMLPAGTWSDSGGNASLADAAPSDLRKVDYLPPSADVTLPDSSDANPNARQFIIAPSESISGLQSTKILPIGSLASHFQRVDLRSLGSAGYVATVRSTSYTGQYGTLGIWINNSTITDASGNPLGEVISRAYTLGAPPPTATLTQTVSPTSPLFTVTETVTPSITTDGPTLTAPVPTTLIVTATPSASATNTSPTVTLTTSQPTATPLPTGNLELLEFLVGQDGASQPADANDYGLIDIADYIRQLVR